MYFVYLLKTNHAEKEYYIGSTPDLKRRFLAHQKGNVFSTKSKLPVKLIYYECYDDKNAALKREKSLKKSGSAYMGLMKRLNLK